MVTLREMREGMRMTPEHVAKVCRLPLWRYLAIESGQPAPPQIMDVLTRQFGLGVRECVTVAPTAPAMPWERPVERLWLISIRKGLKLSQTDVATLAGISAAVYCRAERGDPVREETQRMISRALGFDGRMWDMYG